MNLSQRRLILLGVFTAMGLGMLWDRYPLPDAGERISLLPDYGAGFASQELPLTATEAAVFGRATVVHRRYAFEGHEWFITVVDATNNRHAAHDPSYCFRGAGWEILSQETVPIPGGAARRIVADRLGQTLEAACWFSNGNNRHDSFLRYRGQTTLRRLTLGRSGPEPVMVVVQSSQSRTDWPDALRRLIDTLGGPL